MQAPGTAGGLDYRGDEMSVWNELLYQIWVENAVRILSDSKIDYVKLIESKAIQLLTETSAVIRNEELDDFGIVEEIVIRFEKYGLDAGIQHDFG